MAIGTLSNNWKVNGTAIYEPSYKTKIDHESIMSEDSGRTEDGHNHIDWVLTDLVKVYLKWSVLTGNEVSTLISLMQGKEFTLTYFDRGSTRTADVYCSKVSYEQYSSYLNASEGGLYTDISANCIEV